MRTQKELTSFIVLRSNGWSLAKISKQLNIPKTTLFRWEQVNADTIHLLKYVQLEKIQEQYVPSYEEQLKDTHQHLEKIQAALKQHDYSKMSPEFLLQMNFQLQTRLDKIRQQVPLRSPQLGRAMEDLPPIGCVTRDEDFPREGDFSDPNPNVEGEPELEPTEPCLPAEPSTLGRDSVEPGEQVVPPSGPPAPATDCEPLTADSARKHPIIHPAVNGHAEGNGHRNGNGHANGNAHHGSIRVDPCLSVVENQNGTFRNETPPGSKNAPLSINNLEQQERNDRSL